MKGKPISYRPSATIRARLESLSKSTGHSLTYHIEKAIEGHLPELEKRYARELAELKKYPPTVPQSAFDPTTTAAAVNDTGNGTGGTRSGTAGHTQRKKK